MFHIEYPRSRWEEPGYTIAENTSSPPIRWADITTVVIHYPGHNTFAHPVSPSEMITHTRQSQRYYTDIKGYSLGYQWLVSLGGDIIQSRGFDYANAANAPANSYSVSIQIHCEGVGDDADEASPAQVASVNQIIAEATRRAGRPLTVVGHRDAKPTSCPGAKIYRQIQAGVFRPDDTPPSEDAQMKPLEVPRRAYDSRIGKGGPGPFAAGETRRIELGAITAAFVHLTAVGDGTTGYLTISGSPSPSPASILNFDADRITSDGAPIGCPTGAIWVTAHEASVDVIVDVFAETR